METNHKNSIHFVSREIFTGSLVKLKAELEEVQKKSSHWQTCVDVESRKREELESQLMIMAKDIEGLRKENQRL